MVLQDTWLFGGTIAENIGYGHEGATREEIEAAARAAHADRFVRTLPDGYDTVIDDEGAGVSAGEKQLITIARAFLSDPVILVLDEATSSVDTRTEVLIQRAMAKLSHGRTSFVIAHRLSTIRDADVILVMESGCDRGAGHARRPAGRRRGLRPAVRGAVRAGGGRGRLSGGRFRAGPGPVGRPDRRAAVRRAARKWTGDVRLLNGRGRPVTGAQALVACALVPVERQDPG